MLETLLLRLDLDQERDWRPLVGCRASGKIEKAVKSRACPFQIPPNVGKIYKLDLAGKVLGVLGRYGRTPGTMDWSHAVACRYEKTVHVSIEQAWRRISKSSGSKASRVAQGLNAGASAAADAPANLHPHSCHTRLPQRGFLNSPAYFFGCRISFCTRQFNSSATYTTFSDGHAIS